jgi:5-methylcytosine-specific restriction endonuclease McrA
MKIKTIFRAYVPDLKNSCKEIRRNTTVFRYKKKKSKFSRKEKIFLKEKKRDQCNIEKMKIYHAYIDSAEWKVLRNLVLERCKNYCEDCGKKTKFLHIHHITYLRFGKELLTDLQALCVKCHSKPEKHPWKWHK